MDKVFRRAASKALLEWGQDDGLEDLVNDLWVWFMERPGTQAKMEPLSYGEQVKTAKNAAFQILSGRMLAGNTFNGRNLYSSDAVKDALKGRSTNRYLVDILPLAREALAEQNEEQAEAIRRRYEDGEIPSSGADKMMLTRAHKSLTEHVNIIAITAGVDAEGNVSQGPGSRNSVFPETRKTSARISRPTEDLAIALVENPEQWEIVLAGEVPIDAFLKGADAQPIRWDVQRDAWVRDVPGLGDSGAVPGPEADAA